MDGLHLQPHERRPSGHAYQYNNRPTEAPADFEQALKLNPELEAHFLADIEACRRAIAEQPEF